MYSEGISPLYYCYEQNAKNEFQFNLLTYNCSMLVCYSLCQNMRQYCCISLLERQTLCKWLIVDLTSRICWGRRRRAQAAISSQIQQRHRAEKWEECINQMSYSIKNSFPSQNIQENYFLIYVQPYYQAAVKFVDFAVSIWWCCFEFCTTERILYVKMHQWWENPPVPVKTQRYSEARFLISKRKQKQWRLFILRLWKRGKGGHTNWPLY